MYGEGEWVHDDTEPLPPKEWKTITSYSESPETKTHTVLELMRFLTYVNKESNDIPDLKRRIALEEELQKVEKAIKMYFTLERKDS